MLYLTLLGTVGAVSSLAFFVLSLWYSMYDLCCDMLDCVVIALGLVSRSKICIASCWCRIVLVSHRVVFALPSMRIQSVVQHIPFFLVL